MNQSLFQIGEKIKGKYYGVSFQGTIKHKICVNNGRNPAYVYHIDLFDEIRTGFGLVKSIAWNDRDQLKDNINNQLELL